MESREGMDMKKVIALLLTVCMCFAFTACGNSSESDGVVQEEASNERVAATEFQYDLAEGDEQYVENLVFDEDVVISGDQAQIAFVNCAFNGNVINTANVGTRVIITDNSEVNGKLILQNDTKESTIEAAFPKFIVDMPVEVVCEDCFGLVFMLGDQGVVFNGESYTIADAEVFLDAENGMVPYEGQEANVMFVAQWWENGEKIVLVECEYDSML